MRCESYGGLEGDEQCEADAEVRVDCLPARTNGVGEPQTSFICKLCAESFGNDQWAYSFTDLETGDGWEPPPVTYRDVPVYYKGLPKSALRAYVRGDQFTTAADLAMRHVADWSVSTIRLTVEELGVVAHTRAGERVLVRFET